MVKTLNFAVTGANGFLAKHIVTELKSREYKVFELTTNPTNENQTLIDYENSRDIEIVLSKIDVLIHCAWTSSSSINRKDKELQKINSRISKKISEAVKYSGVKLLVGIGSQDELAKSDSPWKDDAPFNPQSYYAEAKLETFNNFKDSGKNVIWARLFSIYGPYDKRDWVINNILKAIKTGGCLHLGACNQKFSLTHVRDAANCILSIIENEVTGIVNIGEIDATSLRNSIELLLKIADKAEIVKFMNTINDRDQIRLPGKLEQIGWSPKISKEVGFAELLKY